MGISEIYIVKRDGKRAAFSVEKIKRAISKAFLSVGGYATDDDLTSVLSRVRVSDGMSVEEIQNQVEVALMAERYFAVAKSYMLYRQKHTEDREDREKLEFLINYCDAKNPATGSKYDANANVENKNIATLIGELPKQNFIRLNRRLLTDRIKEMYGKELSDKYLHLLNNHFIYKNDETSMANYCASITMYPWLLGGTLSVGGNSTRPTNLKVVLRGIRQHGLHRLVDALGGLRDARIPDVHELLHRAGVRRGLLHARRRSGRPLEETAHDRQDDHRLLPSRSSTRSTSPPGHAISRPCSGTSPITTATISNRSSGSSSFRTARSPGGSRCRGCKSGS